MCDKKLDVGEVEQFGGGGGGGTGECHIEPSCGPVCLAYRSAAVRLCLSLHLCWDPVMMQQQVRP